MRILVGRVSRPVFSAVWPVGPGDPTYERPCENEIARPEGLEHEVCLEDDVPIIVQDYVDGLTLADVASGRLLGEREAAQVIAEIADALDYAHREGVVHRDVKPSNVLVNQFGQPFLIDFGLAHRDNGGEITITVEGEVLGTLSFMSPEQAAGENEQVDGRSDVYSLGVVLYRLLTGELPFRGSRRMLTHQILHDDPPPPRRIRDRVPRDLETICLKAMATEPAKRYATAREFGNDLRRWLNHEPIRARPVGRIERALRWCRRNPAVIPLRHPSGTSRKWSRHPFGRTVPKRRRPRKITPRHSTSRHRCECPSPT